MELLHKNVTNTDTKQLDFLVSALTEKNPFMETKDFMDWFIARKQAHNFVIEKIPFSDLRNWEFNNSTGNLQHLSGKCSNSCNITRFAGD